MEPAHSARDLNGGGTSWRLNARWLMRNPGQNGLERGNKLLTHISTGSRSPLPWSSIFQQIAQPSSHRWLRVKANLQERWRLVSCYRHSAARQPGMDTLLVFLDTPARQPNTSPLIRFAPTGTT